MIVILEPYGDHSNRLFQSLHFHAWCLEQGHRFHNPTMVDMLEDFGRPRGEVFWARLLRKIFRVAARSGVLKTISFDVDADEARGLARLQRSRFAMVTGWCFHQRSLTDRHRAQLIPFYVAGSARIAGDALLGRIDAWRAAGRTILGLHVRRGDYANFRGGRYLFTDGEFLEIVARWRDELRAIGVVDTAVVVFTNGKPAFAETDELVISRSPWWIDHLAMARCDYLLGPPSTFTLWASYIGPAKVLQLETADATIDLADFARYQG